MNRLRTPTIAASVALVLVGALAGCRGAGGHLRLGRARRPTSA
jgi:hypothetical protein